MKRKYSGKRKRSYKSTPRKKARVSKTLKAAVKRIVKSNIETKEFVIGNYNQNFIWDTCYVLNPLYNLSNGSADYQRLGNRIRLQRIEFRGIVSNGSTPAAYSFFPGFCYLWFLRAPVVQVGSLLAGFTNISSTAAHDILFDTPTGGPVNFLKVNRKRGTQVLGFKKIFFTPNSGPSTAGSYPTTKPFQMFINMKNSPFEFEEGNTGFQTKYNYYFVCQSFTQNQTTPLAVSVNLRYDCRIFFKDA